MMTHPTFARAALGGFVGTLPGSPAVRGTAWGVALWLVAQTVVMPMMGAGLFSSAMGGMMAATGP